MTHFEFILIMISLVMAIGVTQLLQGAVRIFRNRDTLDLDWVPLVWMSSLFTLLILHWWSLWGFRDVAWTFPYFVFMLIPPIFMYLGVSMLLPADVTQTGVSLRAGFEKVRIGFMAIMLIAFVTASLDGWLLGTEPAWNALRLAQAGIVTGSILALATPNRRVQELVALTILAILVFASFVLRFLPAAFENV